MANLLSWLRRGAGEPVTEAAPAPVALATPERRGFEYGIGPGGLTEAHQGIGAATQTDRRSLMQQLFEAFLACPWAWASVNAISRTITAGGLVVDWVNDDGEGDQEQPEKPANVLALERLLKFCNPREDIRQLLRSTIADLLVFGDAFIEVVWIGAIPVALYTLDSPSMLPLSDEHGDVSGYVQITENGQRAEFEPREVIHISLDAPRSGVFGISPTQAALLPITAWLFTAATLKETYRKGNPPNIHADLPRELSSTDTTKWASQYMTRNVGPRNIGQPVITKGGGTIKELQQSKIGDALATLSQKRDEILACYGVPPAQAGVIESGNLGGGTGETQRKTYEVNTCDPISAILVEKLVYALVTRGFQITGWTLKFQAVDMRDSEVIEKIRDQRVATGVWTLNRARAEIGEPPVDGGDTPIYADRTQMFVWRDAIPYAQSMIAYRLRGGSLSLGDPADEDTPVALERIPEGVSWSDGLPQQPAAGAPVGNPDDNPDGNPDDGGSDVGAGGAEDNPFPAAKDDKAAAGKKDTGKKDDVPPEESYLEARARLAEWHHGYRQRRQEALEALQEAA